MIAFEPPGVIVTYCAMDKAPDNFGMLCTQKRNTVCVIAFCHITYIVNINSIMFWNDVSIPSDGPPK
jgi:hypothetical protein